MDAFGGRFEDALRMHCETGPLLFRAPRDEPVKRQAVSHG
ncbi:hypothetical protein J2S35_000785 [Falsarthrobacter nasiphocae]|uniref:Uncharacterized protein n=1 Tax=Falsarthrobacter nasiphocae TaxID=189863 RepID=A0AAE3YGQ6_9MICC|nr:hypothetical protein [Falsarthrobacter nasiphocae]